MALLPVLQHHHVRPQSAQRKYRIGSDSDRPMMRAPATRAEIWTAITREYVEPDQLAATVQRVAERLFATYPGKKPR